MGTPHLFHNLQVAILAMCAIVKTAVLETKDGDVIADSINMFIEPFLRYRVMDGSLGRNVPKHVTIISKIGI